MKSTRTTVALGIALAAFVVAAPAAEASTTSVSVTNFAYTAKTVTVQRGSTVRWTNRTAFTTHTVTADNRAYSYTLRPGQSVSRTYGTTGTKRYHCTLHPQMVGTVVVK